MNPVLIFDSGLGGLSVLRAVRTVLPRAGVVYAADNGGFPYGDRESGALTDRIVALFDELITSHRPAAAVIACNTASTLVLPALRARFDLPFVGTVPAVKPAAAATRSGLVSVLATPGTAARDYTQGLIRDFARDIDVTLVGAARLASLAEAAMGGEKLCRDDLVAEIGPAFIERGGRRTDTIVLGCTHYPLIRDALERAAPWPVQWIDPTPAIARRLSGVLGAEFGEASGQSGLALFSAPEAVSADVRRMLDREGLEFAGGFTARADIDGGI